MKRMNLGCGPDIKEGWINVDSVPIEGAGIFDARGDDLPWIDDLDFILINHVLCTMIPSDVDKVLKNCYKMLKTGGKLQVIDMDVLKAFEAYEAGDDEHFPIEEGEIWHKLCMHVSGYGTRLSLFTSDELSDTLFRAGFSHVEQPLESGYDFRPVESVIMEATK